MAIVYLTNLLSKIAVSLWFGDTLHVRSPLTSTIKKKPASIWRQSAGLMARFVRTAVAMGGFIRLLLVRSGRFVLDCTSAVIVRYGRNSLRAV